MIHRPLMFAAGIILAVIALACALFYFIITKVIPDDISR
jgi:hypothetical protein